MGFFHCDIEFRNTVIFKNILKLIDANFKAIFKLIDFDYLFKVRSVGASDIEKKAYQLMIEMIEEALKIGLPENDDNIVGFLFRRLKKFD